MDIFKLMVRRVFTCRPHDSLDTAAGIMWDNDVGCAPVVDEAGRVAGMITDRDITMAAYTRGVPLIQIDVASVMSRDVRVCSPHQTVGEAEEAMCRGRVRRMPVVDGEGKLVGIVSLNDLAREAIRQQKRRQRDVSGDEIAATLAAVGENPRQPPRKAIIS